MNVTTIEFGSAHRIDKKFMSIYERLQRIVKSYYGGTLTYKAFSEQDNHREKTLKTLLKKNDPLCIENKIIFPIFLSRIMVGFCEVQVPAPLDSNARGRLRHLINVLLIHSLKSSQHLHKLRQQERLMEKNLHSSQTQRPLADNVIFLDTQSRSSSHSEALSNNPLEGLKIDKGLTVNLPCLIESKSEIEAFKLARELHDHSHRFAFIQLKDLDLESLESEGFNSLGPVTVYIPELAALTEREQKLLLDFYTGQPRTKDSPLTISSSKYDLKTLLDLGVTDLNLLPQLSVVQLEMTHTFAHYKEMGLMDFILSSMSKKRHS